MKPWTISPPGPVRLTDGDEILGFNADSVFQRTGTGLARAIYGLAEVAVITSAYMPTPSATAILAMLQMDM